jgi:nitroreductase
MNVAEAVASRCSIHAFLDKPVPRETITRVLDYARMAPSGCNFQPWEATVLIGKPLKDLQDLLLGSEPDDPAEYDWAEAGRHKKYLPRRQSVGGAIYRAMGIKREEAGQMDVFARSNLLSFGAPVLLLCRFRSS